MSETHERPVDGAVTLLPHQRSLVERFFRPNGKRVIMLKAEVGLGKGTALIAIAARLVREQPASRVLFLVPSALHSQTWERLRDSGTPSLCVDRLRYREMLDSQPRREMWPSGSVVVMSREFARQADICESLSGTRWRLLIVDEAHGYRGQASGAALRHIAESAERVVLATATSPDLQTLLETSPEATDVVEWRRDAVVDEAGVPLFTVPRPVLHQLSFDLSPSELILIHVVDILGHAAASSGSPHIAESLRRLVASSPPAIERTVRQLEERLDNERRGDLGSDAEPDDETPNPGVPGHDAVGTEKARNATAAVLAQLETLKADSKLNMFGELLRRLTAPSGSPRRVCVLTSYLGTLYYLATEMMDTLGIEVSLLEGRLSLDDRQGALAAIEDSGGVLLATRAALPDHRVLREMTDLVLYDAPRGGDAVAEMLSHFDRVDRLARLNVHVLVPLNEPDAFTQAVLGDIRQALEGPELSR
jgi:hypothetical protein